MTEDKQKPHYHGHRQRLRQRFLRDGGTSMADYELVELLLTLALPRRDVKPIAKDLIAAFGSFADIVVARPEQLSQVKGMGETAVVPFKLVQEAALRLLRQEGRISPQINSFDSLVDYCRAAMSREPIEQFRILFLDTKNKLIADEVQQKGTIDHTAVYPREVVKRSLELNAAAVILAHNHPSGDPTPSQADIDMTRTIRDAASALDIAVHDHIIVGRQGSFSFRAAGYL